MSLRTETACRCSFDKSLGRVLQWHVSSDDIRGPGTRRKGSVQLGRVLVAVTTDPWKLRVRRQRCLRDFDGIGDVVCSRDVVGRGMTLREGRTAAWAIEQVGNATLEVDNGPGGPVRTANTGGWLWHR